MDTPCARYPTFALLSPQAQRYYGAYAPRARCARRLRLAADSAPPDSASPVRLRDDSPAARARRLTWAQLLRRVLEIEPLACPTCPAQLRIVGFLTDPRIVDRILAHLHRTRPGLFPPPRGSPAATPTLCRTDADGMLFAQDFPPDV